MRRLITLTAVLATEMCAAGLGIHSHAEELKGAKQVLEEASAFADEPQREGGRHFEFAARLADLEREVPGLSAEEAARRWLALLDEAMQVAPTDATAYYHPTTPQHPVGIALRHVPPPTTWEALIRLIRERPPVEPGSGKFVQRAALEIFAEALEGDVQGQEQAAERLAVQLPQVASEAHRQALDTLIGHLLEYVRDPQLARRQLERQMQAALEGTQYGLTVPDLVSVLGEEEARALLAKLLVLPAEQIQFSSDRTRRLAREVAVEVVDQMPSPRWDLVDDASQTSMELFEKLQERFPRGKPRPDAAAGGFFAPLVGQFFAEPDDGMGEWEYQRARVTYFVALVANDRSEDALNLVEDIARQSPDALSMGYFGLSALGDAGQHRQLADFLHRMLQKDPTLPLWDVYFQTAARAGRSDEAVAVAELAAARQDLDAQQQVTVRRFLASALLADDQVDAGIEMLRETIRLAEEQNRWDDAQQAAAKLANVGRLLGRHDVAEEGLQLLESFSDKTNANEMWFAMSQASSHVQLLMQMNRFVEAEAVLLKKLKQSLANEQMPGYNAGQYLVALAHVYATVGRYEDVMTLVDEAPYWSAGDLSELLSSGSDYGDKQRGSLAAVIGRALQETGREDTAIRLVEFALQHDAGDDGLYQLLVDLRGQDAMDYLDRLYEQDRFQERPLIWKAELLRRAGKLDEAEETAQAAIAVDPSDGEQGKGDRMRVYAVLADVYRDRGNAAQEKFFRRVVGAIRISEDADDLFEAGLLKRAIQMYREALAEFSDAYCIQSRLAVQLSSMGRDAEAAEHYRRAYQLMPDSFGRMESHCFGCESIFTGKQAQEIAEEVFTKMVAERPESPQVHYMLGYLRMQQRRPDEALEHFLAAVERDPDYINAWTRIVSLGEQTQLPLDKLNEAALNLLRLDPLGRHTSESWQKVTDLHGLWKTYEAILQRRGEPVEFRYPLKTATQQATAEEWDVAMVQDYGWATITERPASPAAAVAQQQVIAALQPLLMPAAPP